MSETDMNADNNSITDDLLDELDKLETSTDTMEAEVERVTENQETLAKSDSPNAIEAATISLESAKTAQQAAEQCQSATEAAVQLSQEQKRQAMELADSNVAWRQSVRNINKELDSSKSSATIMLVIAIIVSVISTSVMGFLFYSVHKKNEALKGAVEDIISTQTELLNKQMTLKTDQMVSLVESIITSNQHRAPAAETAPAPMPQPEAEVKPEPQHVAPSPAPVHEAPAATATVTAEIGPELKKQIDLLSQVQKQQMDKLDALMAELSKQQKIEDKQISAGTGKTTIKTAPIEVTSMGLTESQVKKLNAILWRVADIGKQMKALQASVAQLQKASASKKATVGKAATAAPQNDAELKSIQSSLKDLSNQIQQVKTQQDALKTQLNEVKKETPPPSSYEYKAPSPGVPASSLGAPKPYSYRAPE
ncbi:hypothetical protein [Hydrogenovibrio marinus]|uniref:Uncharacterized protein n=1 Tax=Hydrogenovibrio marinus TaxID=28885 RepID=A0A066ZPB0_HYDMR|nr:hypothetical protein [Hydrogenovibrio marinus]KDN95638.1 hypothetical protein EI16_04880 [Hydrogenovibrio marinus]BBN60135.1 hypothetical protein HVMH_1729 [Hydrogenovibrio marinus]